MQGNPSCCLISFSKKSSQAAETYIESFEAASLLILLILSRAGLDTVKRDHISTPRAGWPSADTFCACQTYVQVLRSTFENTKCLNPFLCFSGEFTTFHGHHCGLRSCILKQEWVSRMLRQTSRRRCGLRQLMSCLGPIDKTPAKADSDIHTQLMLPSCSSH